LASVETILAETLVRDAKSHAKPTYLFRRLMSFTKWKLSLKHHRQSELGLLQQFKSLDRKLGFGAIHSFRRESSMPGGLGGRSPLHAPQLTLTIEPSLLDPIGLLLISR
jgi:hypothetical protein